MHCSQGGRHTRADWHPACCVVCRPGRYSGPLVLRARKDEAEGLLERRCFCERNRYVDDGRSDMRRSFQANAVLPTRERYCSNEHVAGPGRRRHGHNPKALLYGFNVLRLSNASRPPAYKCPDGIPFHAMIARPYPLGKSGKHRRNVPVINSTKNLVLEALDGAAFGRTSMTLLQNAVKESRKVSTDYVKSQLLVWSVRIRRL